MIGFGARAGLGQELHAKRDDLVLAALVALLVLPGPILQPAFESRTGSPLCRYLVQASAWLPETTTSTKQESSC
jgi:hypothetical protein